MQTESKSIKETLEPILHVLSDLGGKFVFTDDEGSQFVIASKDVFEQEQIVHVPEQQLELPRAARVADAIRKNIDSSIGDDVIERINRDIALTHAQEKLQAEQEESEDDIDDLIDIAVETDDSADEDTIELSYTRPLPPLPPRIRFESVKGDLPPQLQD